MCDLVREGETRQFAILLKQDIYISVFQYKQCRKIEESDLVELGIK